MRSQAYTYGVRRKPRFSWLKAFVILVVLALVVGAGVFFVPKTQFFASAKQVYQATFGRNDQSQKLQIEQTEQVVPAEAIADALKPNVQITAPVGGQSLSGDVRVQAQASDNIKVAKVEFYVDGGLVGTDEQEPYEYNWATSGESNGRHSLLVKAYDVANNSAQAQASLTTLNKPKDSTAPTVSVTAPGNGSLVKGVVVLRATAYDPSGLARVEFYVGTALVGADDKAPFTLNWDASKSSGVQKITARAYDATGNINTSGIVTVLVDAGPADTIKPEVALSHNDNRSTLSGTVMLNASASDDTGVAKVEFYRGNTLLFTDTKAPYAYAWDTLSVENGDYRFTAKAYDASGNVQTSRVLGLTANNPKDAKPPVKFAVPSLDSPNIVSEVTLFGACNDKLVGKSTNPPTALVDMQVMMGYEFTASCVGGGKTATVSVDLGREVLNRGMLKVLKVRADGTVTDITLSSTIDTRKTNGAPHTFVTYSVTDGGENDQDGAINGALSDPVFIAQEIKLKDIEQPLVQKKPEVQPATPEPVAQPASVPLVDAMHVREYVPYGIGALLLGAGLFLLRPRRGYRLHS